MVLVWNVNNRFLSVLSRGGRMKLKCKKCGNEDNFFIIEKFSGVTELCADAYDGANYKLKSVYYYCCNCKSKVGKIPEEKRY